MGGAAGRDGTRCAAPPRVRGRPGLCPTSCLPLGTGGTTCSPCVCPRPGPRCTVARPSRSADLTMRRCGRTIARPFCSTWTRTTQIDIRVRTADPEVLAALRMGCGRALFAPENPLALAMPRLSPHWLSLCRFARLEVYQRIPGRDEQPPAGPHTHVLPALLRHQRTHPATAPIPDGWIPCLSLYPANPVSDALGHPRPSDHAAHAAFQALLRGFGDPTLVRLKAAVTAAVRADEGPRRFHSAGVACGTRDGARSPAPVGAHRWRQPGAGSGWRSGLLHRLEAPEA